MIRKIKAGPFVYEIKYVNKFIDERTDNDTGLSYLKTGEIDYINQVITISTLTKPDFQVITLFHELIHSILVNGGFKNQEELEPIIETLSIGLFQILKDNKSLRDLIGDNFK